MQFTSFQWGTLSKLCYKLPVVVLVAPTLPLSRSNRQRTQRQKLYDQAVFGLRWSSVATAAMSSECLCKSECAVVYHSTCSCKLFVWKTRLGYKKKMISWGKKSGNWMGGMIVFFTASKCRHKTKPATRLKHSKDVQMKCARHAMSQVENLKYPCLKKTTGLGTYAIFIWSGHFSGVLQRITFPRDFKVNTQWQIILGSSWVSRHCRKQSRMLDLTDWAP